MPPAPRPSLDELVPSWHWRSRHTIIIERPPMDVFTMLGDVVVADLPIAPRRPVRKQPVRVLDDLLRQGYRLFSADPPDGYLLARIGRFWNRTERHAAPAAAQDEPAWFVRFAAPGFAKAGLGFSCRGLDDDRATLLVAETRILATDEETHQEFNRHWLVSAWANSHGQEQLLRAVHRRLDA